MGYNFIGKLVVERHAPEDGQDPEDGLIEVLDLMADGDSLYIDAEEDLISIVYAEEEVPAEPGIYVLMYAATLRAHQDYFGEWDVEPTVHWSSVTKLSDEETKDVIAYFIDTADENKE